jgi:hypothetical protein
MNVKHPHLSASILALLAAAAVLLLWQPETGLHAQAIDGSKAVDRTERPRADSTALRNDSETTVLETELSRRSAVTSASTSPQSSLAELQGIRRTVTGRVVASNGRPIPATIHLSTGDPVGLPIEVPEIVEMWDEFEVATATTDAEGVFELALEHDLSDGFGLAVEAPGHTTLRLWRVPVSAVWEDRTLQLGTLQLASGRELRGHVHDTSGAPVSGANVGIAIVPGEQGSSVSFPNRAIPRAVTGEDGSFVLSGIEPGALTIQVEARGFVTARRSVSGIEWRGEVVLSEGRKLSGRLVGYPGGTEALEVEARPWYVPQEDRELPELDPPTFHQGVRRADVGTDGTFTLEGLLPGAPHVLRVRRQIQDSYLVADEVAPTEAPPDATYVEVPWRPRLRAIFRALDSQGRPVALHRLTVHAWTRGEDQPARVDWVAGDPYTRDVLLDLGNGHYELRGPCPDDSTERVLLAPRALGFVCKEHHVDAIAQLGRSSGAVDLGTLSIESAPDLSVRAVDDATGAPIAGADVFVLDGSFDSDLWWMRDRHGRIHARTGAVRRTDGDGVARLLRPARAKVSVLALAPGSRRHPRCGSTSIRPTYFPRSNYGSSRREHSWSRPFDAMVAPWPGGGSYSGGQNRSTLQRRNTTSTPRSRMARGASGSTDCPSASTASRSWTNNTNVAPVRSAGATCASKPTRPSSSASHSMVSLP